MDFGQRIANLRSKAKDQELVVFVWGPGDPGSHGDGITRLYWEKRNQIKKEIKVRFTKAQVFFSEDAEVLTQTAGLGNTLDQELVHAVLADCILVLDVSRGASVEVDRFSSNPVIAAKMTLLIPQRFVGTTGLVSYVHAKLNVVGFTDEELQSCFVATTKAIQVVETAAISKFLNTFQQLTL